MAKRATFEEKAPFDCEKWSVQAKQIFILLCHHNLQAAHDALDAFYLSAPEPLTLDSPLSATDLSVRIVSALEWYGLRTVRDVLSCTTSELIEIPQLERKSVALIRDEIKQIVRVCQVRTSRKNPH